MENVNKPSYIILSGKCVGCGHCARVCPHKAIQGQHRKTYAINPLKCVRCGKCIRACRFGAVQRG
ncbi:4Fe-4S binding protein [Ethanoligenens sp.]|uniref:4Fe-4S binding protein n=1 Tax=Ethanoligenens sp. TaxID=2099655 RepID=UPI0039E81467